MSRWARDAVLVDSSAWVDHLQGRESSAALQLAQWLLDEPDRIVVNSVVTCELVRGVRGEAAAAKLLASLKKMPQADAIVHDDWLASASIYRRCRGAGLTIRSPMDCLLAAHAMRLGLPVLAVDRDFDAIAAHHPLALLTAARH